MTTNNFKAEIILISNKGFKFYLMANREFY